MLRLRETVGRTKSGGNTLETTRERSRRLPRLEDRLVPRSFSACRSLIDATVPNPSKPSKGRPFAEGARTGVAAKREGQGPASFLTMSATVPERVDRCPQSGEGGPPPRKREHPPSKPATARKKGAHPGFLARWAGYKAAPCSSLLRSLSFTPLPTQSQASVSLTPTNPTSVHRRLDAPTVPSLRQTRHRIQHSTFTMYSQLAVAALAAIASVQAAPLPILATVEAALSTPNTTQYNQTAVSYFMNGNNGACGWANQDSDKVVGLPNEFYQDLSSVSPYCGKYIVVTDPRVNKTVTALVADASTGNNTLSLSQGTWNALNGTASDLSAFPSSFCVSARVLTTLLPRSAETVDWRFANETETAAAKAALSSPASSWSAPAPSSTTAAQQQQQKQQEQPTSSSQKQQTTQQAYSALTRSLSFDLPKLTLFASQPLPRLPPPPRTRLSRPPPRPPPSRPRPPSRRRRTTRRLRRVPTLARRPTSTRTALLALAARSTATRYVPLPAGAPWRRSFSSNRLYSSLTRSKRFSRARRTMWSLLTRLCTVGATAAAPFTLPTRTTERASPRPLPTRFVGFPLPRSLPNFVQTIN